MDKWSGLKQAKADCLLGMGRRTSHRKIKEHAMTTPGRDV